MPSPSSAGQPVLPLKQRLSKCIVDFSSRLASTKSGALVQVWMPEQCSDGTVVLSAHGLPFAVVGVGDLLALFRCVSVRYRFSTDLTRPALMGAIGRVYATMEPEMSHDVQKYDKQVYLRVSEAQRCRVHSALMVPVFDGEHRDRPLAVLELVQADKDVVFPQVMDWLQDCLQGVSLSTVTIEVASGGAPGFSQWPMHVEQDKARTNSKNSRPLPACGSGNNLSTQQQQHSGGDNRQSAQNVSGSGTLTGQGVAKVQAQAQQVPQQQQQQLHHVLQAQQAQQQGGDATQTSSAPRPIQDENEVVSGSSPSDQQGSHNRLHQIHVQGPPSYQQQPQTQQSQQQQQAQGGFTFSSALPAVSQGTSLFELSQLQTEAPQMTGSAPGMQAQQNQHQNEMSGAGPMCDVSSSLSDPQQISDQQQQMRTMQSMQQQLSGSLETNSNGQMAQFMAMMAQNQTKPVAAPALVQSLRALAASGAIPAIGNLPGPSPPGSATAIAGSTVAGAAASLKASGSAKNLGAKIDADEDCDDFSEDEGDADGGGSDDEGGGRNNNNRVGGGAGRRLKLEDLQAQFGLGLKEAASNLGICATTLKRACRRHGIKRWPRRQIVKLSKALNQMGYQLPAQANAAAGNGGSDSSVAAAAAAAVAAAALGNNNTSAAANPQQQQQIAALIAAAANVKPPAVGNRQSQPKADQLHPMLAAAFNQAGQQAGVMPMMMAGQAGMMGAMAGQAGMMAGMAGPQGMQFMPAMAMQNMQGMMPQGMVQNGGMIMMAPNMGAMGPAMMFPAGMSMQNAGFMQGMMVMPSASTQGVPMQQQQGDGSVHSAHQAQQALQQAQHTQQPSISGSSGFTPSMNFLFENGDHKGGNAMGPALVTELSTAGNAKHGSNGADNAPTSMQISQKEGLNAFAMAMSNGTFNIPTSELLHGLAGGMIDGLGDLSHSHTANIVAASREGALTSQQEIQAVHDMFKNTGGSLEFMDLLSDDLPALH